MTRTPEKPRPGTQGGTGRSWFDSDTPRAVASHADDNLTASPVQRDPANTLRGCQRILILGRTGSGKTTLARELAAAIDAPHVELDALYFGPSFSTVPLSVLRDRTTAAISGDRWVTDGNKR